MDFFGAQDAARRRSRRLRALLLVCVLLVALSAAFYVGLLVALVGGGQGLPPEQWLRTLGERMLAVPWPVYACVTIFALVDSLYTGVRRMRQLRGGGLALAERMGATRVDAAAPPATGVAAEFITTHSYRQLLNVVDEMSLASGQRPPAVYVLTHERSINALAAARGADDAAVIVTQGAVERLQRDELQGLVGFAMGQVTNGDIRLNTQMLAWFAAVSAVARTGAELVATPFRGVASESLPQDLRKLLFVFGLLALLCTPLILIGSLGVPMVKLVQALACRQRVYLNDAAAVQFTRDPAAVADALRRVLKDGGRLVNRRRDEVAHMSVVPVQRAWLFRTHPPLRSRIARIEPQPVPAHARGGV